MRKRTTKILSIFEKYGFHPVDVEYLDGYFIMDFGKDSVVHFHIKECKGWKFSIWWNKSEDCYSWDFFTQYEKNIDKFKPTASTFVEEDLNYDENVEMEIKLTALKILKFIKKHPLKAWYADGEYAGDKLWVEMPSNPKLLFLFMKERLWEDYIFPARRARLNKKYLEILRIICEYSLEDYKIIDENQAGLVCYPRWRIVAKNFKDDKVKKKGNYALDLADVPKDVVDKATKFSKKLERYGKRNRRLVWEMESFDNLYVWLKGGK